MVLRVKPTPTRFPTNSLYTPMGNTPLHSISSVRRPWGSQLILGNMTKASYQPCSQSLNSLQFGLADIHQACHHFLEDQQIGETKPTGQETMLMILLSYFRGIG